MDSYNNCISAAIEASGGTLSRREVGELFREMSKELENLTPAQRLASLEQTVRGALDRQISSNVLFDAYSELAAMRTNMFLETTIPAIKSRAGESLKGSKKPLGMAQALKEFFVGSPERMNSLQASVQGSQAQFMGPLTQVLNEGDLVSRWGDNETMSQVIDGLFTGKAPADQGAAKIYGALKKSQDLAYVRLNSVGVPTANSPLLLLSSRVADPVKVRKMGEQRFVQLIESLNLNTQELPTGKTLAEYATDLYHSLTRPSDGGFDYNSLTYLKNSKKVKEMGARFGSSSSLPFKDATSFLAYFEATSEKTLGEAIFSRIDQTGRATGVMSVLGPNPGTSLYRMLSELEQDMTPAEQRFFLGRDITPSKDIKQGAKAIAEDVGNALSMPKPATLLAQLTGEINTPESTWLATGGAMSRSLGAAAALTWGIVAQLPDMAFQMQYLAGRGNRNFAEVFANNFVNMFPDRQAKELLGKLNITAEAALENLLDVHGQLSYTPKPFKFIVDTAYKLNFMRFWDTALRRTTAILMQDDMINAVLRGIDTDSVEEFARYGLTRDELKSLVDTASVNTARGRMIDVDRIPKDMSGTAHKFNAAIQDMVSNAVSTPKAAERAMLTMGTKAGTPNGELVRAIAQFKTFPLMMHSRTLPRVNYDSGKAGVATTILGAMVLWYIGDSAKQMAQGKEPRDPTDADTVFKAFLYTGVLGMGDLLIPQGAKTGQEWAGRAIGGPTLSKLGDVAIGVTSIPALARQALNGEELKPNAAKRGLTAFLPSAGPVGDVALREAILAGWMDMWSMGLINSEDEWEAADRRATKQYNEYGRITQPSFFGLNE